jgi:hypothetical protein
VCWPVLRHNSKRTENSALLAATAVPSRLSLHPRAPRISPGRTPARYTCNPDVFATPLVRIRQPDRTGGAALPVAHEKGRDLRIWCEFCRLAFPSPVRNACGPRGSSEYTPRAGVSGGVRQLLITRRSSGFDLCPRRTLWMKISQIVKPQCLTAGKVEGDPGTWITPPGP